VARQQLPPAHARAPMRCTFAAARSPVAQKNSGSQQKARNRSSASSPEAWDSGNAQAADQTCHLTLESKGGWVAAYTSSIVCCRIWEVSTELVASAILASKLTHARPRRPPALLAVQEALAPAQRLAAQGVCSAARTGRAGGSGSRQLCSRCTTPPSVPGRRTWALSTRSAARSVLKR